MSITSTELKVLKLARSTLVNKGWTKGDFARRPDGKGTHSSDPDAVCYCAVGAINYAIRELDLVWRDAVRAQDHLATDPILKKNGCASVLSFNDLKCTTKQDVLDLFTRTINRAS